MAEITVSVKNLNKNIFKNNFKNFRLETRVYRYSKAPPCAARNQSEIKMFFWAERRIFPPKKEAEDISAQDCPQVLPVCLNN